MSNKNLVLFINNENDEENNVLLDKINDLGIADAACTLHSCNIILRVFRRIILLYNLPFVHIWFAGWKDNIQSYDTVVCIASKYSPTILKWIRKKNPNATLINYYWDKMEISGYPFFQSEAYENWSFDKQDCIKYGMKYNAQFYVDELRLDNPTEEYEVSFVGADREGLWKERYNIVEKYYNLFTQYKINSFFYFVSKEGYNSDFVYSKRMTEKEYYEITSKSKAILEIVQPEKEWLTLRPLLAISNNKKLITNNKYIKEEKFYSKNNIFILDEDDNEKLREFIDEPFKQIDEEILKYYEFEQWLHRFSN